MRGRSALLLCTLILGSEPSFAAGIGMKWNDCLVGASDLQFACDTNDGTSVLVGWFDPPPGVTQLIGQEVVVDLCAMAPDLPSWWQMGSGECRDGAWTGTSSFVGSGLATCEDYWRGRALNIARYLSRYHDPNDARMVLMATLTQTTQAGPVLPGHNYYAFRYEIAHAKATDPDPCSGCQTPVCIVFNSIRLVQPPGLGDVVLDTSDVNDYAPMYATWQGGPPNCPFVVPVRRSTWGKVKSLYR